MGRAGVVVFALRASRGRWAATGKCAQSGRFVVTAWFVVWRGTLRQYTSTCLHALLSTLAGRNNSQSSLAAHHKQAWQQLSSHGHTAQQHMI